MAFGGFLYEGEFTKGCREGRGVIVDLKKKGFIRVDGQVSWRGHQNASQDKWLGANTWSHRTRPECLYLSEGDSRSDSS